MSEDPWIRLALETPLENYEVFLKSRGFTFRDSLGPAASLFEAQSGETIVLPLSKTFADYSIRIADVVDTVSKVLKEDRDGIARLIASVGYDVFRIRTEIGRQSFSVDLDDALDLLHNGYSIVDYSAVYATSDKTVSYVHGRRRNEVATYLDTVRMGQTEPGSFVLTLLLPIIGQKDLAENVPSELSLGQRISDAIARGLQSSKEALQEYDQAGQTKSGEFNANFVSALAEIVSHAPQVEMGVDQRFSRKIHRVSFERSDEEPLREIAESLTPKVKSWQATISGTVINVTEPRAQRSGTFLLEAMVDGVLKNVRVNFGKSDRKTVIKAFDEKSEYKLSVRGRINKSYSGRYTIDAANEIRLTRRGDLA